jgi:serine/threonine protein kinase/tetratricopeptide (TPR) repeat protein
VEIPVIGQTVSHYKILERLGGGGMGVVYKAQDLKLERLVALKFLPPGLTLDPEAKRRFIHEAQAASALDHPNICTIHEIGETEDGRLFLAMACYDGETLKQKIERGPLPVDQAVSIALQVAQGLAKAHESGIVHRDIKPANIIITRDGLVKILDFGLAKLSGQTILTRTGSRVGTAAYMSPEQAGGEVVDQRTDIWSLGVVLYEMLGGQRPFKAEYENALIYSILNQDPAPLTSVRPEVAVALSQIVEICLAKSPGQRYKSIDEFIVDMRPWRDENVQIDTHRKTVQAPRQRKWRLIWSGLSAFGILGAALAGYLLFSTHGDDSGSLDGLKMIAVLPFENLGPAEDEYFADGLTDEITSRLSAIGSLGVISRTSAMQYKRTKKTLPVIADELGVEYILEGTVRWAKEDSGQRLRVTPQLIRVSGDRHLWADNFDRTLEDIFAVQTEIATRVVDALGLVLKAGEKDIVEAIPTKNMDAYQAYLRAVSSRGYEKPKLILAIELLGRAVALDSTFAEAYAILSRCHMAYYFYGYDRSKERVALAKQAVDKAIALDPALPGPYVALGLYYYWGLRDYDRALEAFMKVEKRLPNDEEMLANIAYVWRRQGKFEEAAARLKKVALLDPGAEGTVREIGNTLLQLGRYAEAEGYLDRSIAMLPDQSRSYVLKSELHLRWKGDTKKSREILERVPGQYYPCLWLIWIDIYDRNYQAALDRLEQVAEPALVEQDRISPIPQLRGLIYRFMGDTVRSAALLDSARVFLESEISKRPDDYRLHMALGLSLACLKKTREAVRVTEHAASLMPLSVDAIDGTYPQIALAQVYTIVGMYDAALDKVEFLLGLRAPRFITVPILRLDPLYDPLRTNPRFQALLTRYEHM